MGIVHLTQRDDDGFLNSPLGPVFVGIAREADLDRYLAATAHDELLDVALPHYLVIAVMAGGFTTGWFADMQAPSLTGVLVAIAAIALLVTGRYPRDIFRLVVAIKRWILRVIAYAALMRDEYPPFRLDP